MCPLQHVWSVLTRKHGTHPPNTSFFCVEVKVSFVNKTTVRRRRYQCSGHQCRRHIPWTLSLKLRFHLLHAFTVTPATKIFWTHTPDSCRRIGLYRQICICINIYIYICDVHKTYVNICDIHTHPTNLRSPLGGIPTSLEHRVPLPLDSTSWRINTHPSTNEQPRGNWRTCRCRQA